MQVLPNIQKYVRQRHLRLGVNRRSCGFKLTTIPPPYKYHAFASGQPASRPNSTAAMVSALKAFALLLGATSAICAHAQVLVDFQVAEPPPVPSDAQACTMMILE